MAREQNKGPIIQKEKETVAKMLSLYCCKKHGGHELCAECQDLLDYAMKRLAFCQFGEEKGACANCPVHCYKLNYRQQIKNVMRYASPWMLLYHPIYSIKHMMAKTK